MSRELAKIAEQYNLDPSDPEIKAIIVDLLKKTHVYEGGKRAIQTMVEVDTLLGKGTKSTPAQIESVTKIGEYLSIVFDQSIDWSYLDKNKDGTIALGSELIVEVRAKWVITPDPNNQNQPAELPMGNPLGAATVEAASGGRLLFRIGADGNLRDPDGDNDGRADTLTIEQVMLIGIRDLDGQIGDVVFPPA